MSDISEEIKKEFEKRAIDINSVELIHNTAFHAQQLTTGFNEAYKSIEQLYKIAYQKGIKDAGRHGNN